MKKVELELPESIEELTSEILKLHESACVLSDSVRIINGALTQMLYERMAFGDSITFRVKKYKAWKDIDSIKQEIESFTVFRSRLKVGLIDMETRKSFFDLKFSDRLAMAGKISLIARIIKTPEFAQDVFTL